MKVQCAVLYRTVVRELVPSRYHGRNTQAPAQSLELAEIALGFLVNSETRHSRSEQPNLIPRLLLGPFTVCRIAN